MFHVHVIAPKHTTFLAAFASGVSREDSLDASSPLGFAVDSSYQQRVRVSGGGSVQNLRLRFSEPSMRFMFMFFIAFILLLLLPSQEVATLGGRERVGAE
jgi:hypothetical protein